MIAKEDMPLVSIIVSFFNTEKFLTYTVLSVLNQTYENWELLMLDDGSTDNSLQIARDFEKKDNRIRVYSEGKKGRSGCLNRLVELARGKFLAIIDADDIMVCERLEKQVDFLLNQPFVQVVGSSHYIIDENNEIIACCEYFNNATSYVDAIKKCHFAQPTVMGYLDWFRKNKYDEKEERMEDYALWIRTFEPNIFHNLSDKLLFYRIEADKYSKKSITGKKNEQIYLCELYQYGKISLNYFIKTYLKNMLKLIFHTFLPFIGSNKRWVFGKFKKLSEQDIISAKKQLDKAISVK